MPIMSGLAIGALIGAGVGGASAALQNKDVLQGALMGGVTGAVTGGIGGAMGGAGAATAGTLTGGEAATFMGSGALPTSMAPAVEYGIPSLIDGASSVPLNESAQIYANTPMSGNIASGFNSIGADPMKYIGDNKMSLGLAGLAGSMAPAANQQNTNQNETTFHPYTYSAALNPGYTGAGTSYFDQGYKKLPTYTAANGGIMSLAEGGETASTDSPAKPVKKEPMLADYLAATRTASAAARNIEMPRMQAQYIAPQQQYARPIQQVPQAVTDYNNTLMQRAQNEYVDSPQLGAFSSHFNDPVPKPQNASTTDQMFQKYLGRDADPAGYAANKNASPEQIAYGIQTSPEYMAANPNAPKPVMPSATGPAVYTYNPATRGYMTSYAPVDPKYGIAGLQQSQLNGYGYDQGGGASAAAAAAASGPDGSAGDGGAAGSYAYGGLMSYAMGGGIGADYDDKSRFNHGPEYPMQQPQNFNSGGNIYSLGGYSDGGRLLKGPGDGVSDDIPAQIGDRQPARLADGEFVVPARIVSELGNGSTDAGAKRLYAMMDRVQANRKKTVGKGKVAVNSKSDQYLPA